MYDPKAIEESPHCPIAVMRRLENRRCLSQGKTGKPDGWESILLETEVPITVQQRRIALATRRVERL